MFFTQQTSCLPYVLLITTSWYIGIYTVDTLLYSLCFTNCIILFLPLLSIHPQVFTWVLQPELLLKVITFGKASPTHLATGEDGKLADWLSVYCKDCCWTYNWSTGGKRPRRTTQFSSHQWRTIRVPRRVQRTGYTRHRIRGQWNRQQRRTQRVKQHTISRTTKAKHVWNKSRYTSTNGQDSTSNSTNRGGKPQINGPKTWMI